MLAALLGMFMSQAATVPWPARVSEDEAQGERTLSVTLTPLPPPNRMRLLFYPSWGQARQVDLPESGKPRDVAEEIENAIAAGPAGLVVLTFDTRLPKELGQFAIAAAVSRGLVPELRFAGETNVKGKPMPEVLSLVKDVPVAPPLTRAQIRSVLQAANGEVRACYLKQLEANALEGRMVVDFDVHADGAVSDARVRESQLSAPEVERCVVQVVGALRFPKLRGMPLFSLSWPFRFSRGADKPPPPPIRR